MSRELELITAATMADGRRGPRPAKPGDGPKHAVVHTECLNCGEQLHGRFCARCGQTADDHHRSIFHLAWEVVEDFTHLDGRLAKTIPPLFFRPGSLARDHFEGRRQRHVPPLRLFLVSLLLFMLALEVMVHRGASGPHLAAVADAAAASHGGSRTPGPGIAAPTPQPTPPGLTAPKAPEPPQVDPAFKLTSAPSSPSDTVGVTGTGEAVSALQTTDLSKNKLAAWLLKQAKAAGVSPDYFTSIVFEWAHRLAILLLPIFAMLLTACYFYKRKFYVYDHLLVSMQFLSFIFLISGAAWILPSPLRSPAVTIASIWTPINLFMVLRGAYGSSLAGALVKTFVLWVSTLFLFLSLLIGILVVALGQMH